MYKIANLNNFIDNQEISFPSDRVQEIRRSVLAPVIYKPNIRDTLQRVKFKFHRTCSYSNLIRECNVAEGQTLLIYWGSRTSESRVTISMSASSCSSLHMPNQPLNMQRDRDLRSIAQQTEISCRYSSGAGSPVSLTESEEQRVLRARIADSLTVSSPASSLIQPTRRSVSILGSVCALLLNKQATNEKDETITPNTNPSPTTLNPRSSDICRICFGGASSERLVRPCACRGTVAAVHRACLERWLLQAATSTCELCRYHYRVTRTHKWSWPRSLLEWCISSGGRALAGDAWRGAALGAASVLGTARALHACDAALQAGARRGGVAALAANLFSSLLIGVIGALNGLLTTWILLKIQEHQQSWRAWRDSTQRVRVALSPHSPHSLHSPLSPHSPTDAMSPGQLSPGVSLATVVETRTVDRATDVLDVVLDG